MRLGLRSWQKVAIRYAFAVAVVGLAMAVKSWLERFGPMPPFIIFYPGVLLVASVVGGGPGALTTVLSVLAADYWYFAPFGQLKIESPSEVLALGIFGGSSLLLCLLAERMHRARWAEAVRATQERELALLDLGNVMVLDQDHRIVRWSEGNRRLYGFDAQEAQGRSIQELLQTQLPRPREEIHRELLEKGHWEGEVVQRRKDGSLVTVALMWALRRDERGRPQAILEVGTDLTGQKAAEESLRQQSEELAQQNEELTQQSEELSEQNEELQTQSEEVQALNTELGHREKVLQTLVDSARLPIGEQEVMGKVCQAAMDMIGRAAVGAVVCERQGDELRVLAHAGFDGADVPASWSAIGSFTEVVMQQDRTASLEDASLRPDLGLLSVRGCPRFSAILSSPLHLKGKPVGAVSIFSSAPQQWTAEQFRLIEWLAGKCSNTLQAMRLEAEVHRSQERSEFLATIIETSSQPFAVGYPDGRLGLINKAFEQLTGYSGQELRAIDWARTLTPPEWVEAERQKLEELHRTGLPVRYEKEYLRKDGTRVPIELLVHLVKDAAGQPLYYHSFVTDITERKAATRALEESEGRLEFALETTGAGAWDLNLVDHTAHRSLMHDRIFGYSSLLPEWTFEMFLEHVLPEDRAEVRKRFLHATQTKTDWAFECRIRRADGEVRWIWAGGRHRRDAVGRAQLMSGVVQDITDRKQAEQALAEGRERLDLALRSARMATFDWDIVKNKRTWSDDVHRLLGTSPETFTGRAEEFYQVIHPDDRAAVQAALAKAVETTAPYEAEYRAVWPDGSIHHLAARGMVHRDAMGRPVLMTGICWDITDRKLAEEALRKTVEELQRSNRELEQFAYISSHDLQEPLRQVRAYVQLLRDRHADKLDGKAIQYMQFVYDGAERMSNLVQGLLEYSRVGAREAPRQPVPCQQALDAALANLQAAIAESHATVTHDELPTLQAEPTQLTQLFQNLIGNAVKFHADGVAPHVHVGCRRQGAQWLFSVTDNGIGIAPEFHEKVFLIFQRLHGREKYAGTGIGLAICKKIVEQHGGKIWIESKGGQGSTFHFTLPGDKP